MFQNSGTNPLRWEDSSNVQEDQIAVDFVDIEYRQSDELQITDTLRIFFNEIDLLFDVEGVNDALFHRVTDGSHYQSLITESIKQNSICQEWFEWHVDVKVAQGERRDIMLVTVTITARYDKPDNFVPVYRQWVI